MKLLINNTTYTKINNLRFSPEADLINNSLPIPEFECRVFTNAILSYGQWVDLLDDDDHLYAHYWIRFAERIGQDEDNETYIVRLIAQSPLAFLERVTLPAEMLDDDAWVLIMDILDHLGSMGQDGDIISSNDIDDEVGDVHITGFCPEQSARERLQWILTAAGGYALSAFNDVIYINKVPFSNLPTKTIPVEKTFWKPSISYRDYVTKIKVTGYSYTQGTPTNVDEYVTDGTNYWIVQKQVFTLTNPSLPSGVPDNEIEVDGISLLSSDRASVVASILANHYFNRSEISADVIDNAEYEVGDSVYLYTDIDMMSRGYIERLDFSFAGGKNVRAKMHLIGTMNVESNTLTINYTYNDSLILKEKYPLPKGSQYTITTKYVDKTIEGQRYIFRPTSDVVTGTLTESRTVTVPCEIALKYYLADSSEILDAKGLMTNIEAVLKAQLDSDVTAIKKKYKKNKSKRDKYTKRLRSNFTKNLEKAKAAIQDKALEHEQRLYIQSVDELEIESQTVEDPNDRTVIIS